MDKNLFIVVEGIDGAGKTSVAKELAEQLDGKYYKCPPRIILPLRKVADKSPYRLRYFYYLVGNYIAQSEIKSILKHTVVVCDWYIFSTIAYHSVLLKRSLRIPRILMPDKLVYLSASTSQITSRLAKRKIKSKFEDLNFLEKVRLRYEELISGLNNVIEVNTTDKTVEDSAKQILEKLPKF
jgi:dTMP kinase